MRKYVIGFVALIGLVVIGAAIARLAGFSTYRYAPNALSMHPTLSPGDLCVCQRVKQDDVLKKGSVVLLKLANFDYVLTKRIIAKEGDRLEIKQHEVFVNDVVIDEPYLDPSYNGHPRLVAPLVIGKDRIFVMGDNRDHSFDSRDPGFGPVPIDTVVGRPLVILWSKDRKKIFDRL